jgi:hypothetical protein
MALMSPKSAAILLLAALPGCAGRENAHLVDGGGTTSGGSIAGGSTSGGTTGSGPGGSTTGTTTNSTTGQSGTSGTTGSSNPFCVWVEDRCVMGSCANAPIGSACALDGGGMGLCHAGQCTDFDFENDPNNCGGFDVVCPVGVLCDQGLCATPTYCSASCPAGSACMADGCIISDCSSIGNDVRCYAQSDKTARFCCNGRCIGSDSANCGGCGVTCPQGTVCYVENCVISTPCEPGSGSGPSNPTLAICTLPSGDAGLCCSDTCVDLSDPTHCGACEVACPTGSSCEDHWIGEEQDICSRECMTNADCPDGYACAAQSCYLSRCGPESDGLSCANQFFGQCCGGTCVDITQDPSNCGFCGIACSADEHCYQGACVEFSSSGEYCARADGGLGTACGSSCVDLQSDPAHCRSCAWACPTGATCSAGTCSAACARDADCPTGSVCGSGSCVAPCNTTDPLCSSGFCCGSTCLDLTSDPEHCGSCDQVCPGSGFTCQHGRCISPDGGTLDCSAGDVQCPFGFGCVGSVCEPTSCGANQRSGACAFRPTSLTPYVWGSCCGSACVDWGTDPHNCGGCGIECPSGYCSDYTCVSDPLTDDCPVSCGPGTTCANATCIGSQCDDLAVRQLGHSRCLAQDGALGVCCPVPVSFVVACADLSSDPYNCGACGIACPPGAACANGLCNGLDECEPGHQGSYCDVDAGLSFLCCPGLGCIDTSADPQNCGGCNAACAAGQVCNAGRCGT